MKKKVFIIIFILLALVIGSCTSSCWNKAKEYKEKYKNEDDKIFGTYNKDYKKIVDENFRQIILDIDSSDAKKANVAIVNYISNVGGELISVNGFQTSHNTITPVFGSVPSGSGVSMGMGFVPSTRTDNKIQYILSVPVDAMFADNLQKRLDQYMWYYPWLDNILKIGKNTKKRY